MKINIGIIGYGNLGKATEQIILSKHKYNLVAIFSRRMVKSKFNTIIESYENISLYKDKIDIMLLCGGSFDDLEKQTTDALFYFDSINTFDNHKKIPSEFERLDKIAKNTNHRLIMSCGWDPGIFSIIRTIFFSLSKTKPIVFWGKGISMGHSDAIRKVKNVTDGIEFTIPNKNALKLARLGKFYENEPLHFRQCFVVAEKKYQKTIYEKIKNIPDYFKGQPTTVEFVSHEELLKLKSKMAHCGEIISNFKTLDGSNNWFNFKLKTASNPNLTATILTSYIDAIINLKQDKKIGAFTPLDIPISYLFDKSYHNKLLSDLCWNNYYFITKIKI